MNYHPSEVMQVNKEELKQLLLTAIKNNITDLMLEIALDVEGQSDEHIELGEWWFIKRFQIPEYESDFMVLDRYGGTYAMAMDTCNFRDYSYDFWETCFGRWLFDDNGNETVWLIKEQVNRLYAKEDK